MAGMGLVCACLAGICIGSGVDTAIYFSSPKLAPNTENVRVEAIGVWRGIIAVGMTIASIRCCCWRRTEEDRAGISTGVWYAAFCNAFLLGLFISPTVLIYPLVHFD
jgi:hypothetical protein